MVVFDGGRDVGEERVRVSTRWTTLMIGQFFNPCHSGRLQGTLLYRKQGCEIATGLGIPFFLVFPLDNCTFSSSKRLVSHYAKSCSSEEFFVFGGNGGVEVAKHENDTAKGHVGFRSRYSLALSLNLLLPSPFLSFSFLPPGHHFPSLVSEPRIKCHST